MDTILHVFQLFYGRFDMSIAGWLPATLSLRTKTNSRKWLYPGISALKNAYLPPLGALLDPYVRALAKKKDTRKSYGN